MEGRILIIEVFYLSRQELCPEKPDSGKPSQHNNCLDKGALTR
jgi:hypothetical protein